jgi:hypothetical protein
MILAIGAVRQLSKTWQWAAFGVIEADEADACRFEAIVSWKMDRCRGRTLRRGMRF